VLRSYLTDDVYGEDLGDLKPFLFLFPRYTIATLKSKLPSAALMQGRFRWNSYNIVFFVMIPVFLPS
jgi:hypothetical protein